MSSIFPRPERPISPDVSGEKSQVKPLKKVIAVPASRESMRKEGLKVLASLEDELRTSVHEFDRYKTGAIKVSFLALLGEPLAALEICKLQHLHVYAEENPVRSSDEAQALDCEDALARARCAASLLTHGHEFEGVKLLGVALRKCSALPQHARRYNSLEAEETSNSYSALRELVGILILMGPIDRAHTVEEILWAQFLKAHNSGEDFDDLDDLVPTMQRHIDKRDYASAFACMNELLAKDALSVIPAPAFLELAAMVRDNSDDTDLYSRCIEAARIEAEKLPSSSRKLYADDESIRAFVLGEHEWIKQNFQTFFHQVAHIEGSNLHMCHIASTVLQGKLQELDEIKFAVITKALTLQLSAEDPNQVPSANIVWVKALTRAALFLYGSGHPVEGAWLVYQTKQAIASMLKESPDGEEEWTTYDSCLSKLASSEGLQAHDFLGAFNLMRSIREDQISFRNSAALSLVQTALERGKNRVAVGLLSMVNIPTAQELSKIIKEAVWQKGADVGELLISFIDDYLEVASIWMKLGALDVAEENFKEAYKIFHMTIERVKLDPRRYLTQTNLEMLRDMFESLADFAVDNQQALAVSILAKQTDELGALWDDAVANGVLANPEETSNPATKDQLLLSLLEKIAMQRLGFSEGEDLFTEWDMNRFWIDPALRPQPPASDNKKLH